MTVEEARKIVAAAQEPGVSTWKRNAAKPSPIESEQELLERFVKMSMYEIGDRSGSPREDVAALRLDVDAYAKARGLVSDDDWFEGNCC